MDNKVKAWLEDIVRSIDEIFDFLPEKKDFFEYQKDFERNIEIIGEAINRISKHKNSSLKIKNAQKIIGQEIGLLMNTTISQMKSFGQSF